VNVTVSQHNVAFSKNKATCPAKVTSCHQAQLKKKTGLHFKYLFQVCSLNCAS